MTTFEKLKDKIHSENNSNFYFDVLGGPIQVWIKGLCEIIDEGKLIKLTITNDDISLLQKELINSVYTKATNKEKI